MMWLSPGISRDRLTRFVGFPKSSKSLICEFRWKRRRHESGQIQKFADKVIPGVVV